jgi:AcrR family transcriptional regulator
MYPVEIVKAAKGVSAKKRTERVQPDSSAPQRRRRLAPEDREKEIVDGAIQFFAEVGFDGGLRELAQRLGITHQNLFRYFPTKDALIERVYADVYLSRWNPEWEQMLHQPDRSLKARLTNFYTAYLHSIYRYDWVRIFVFAGLKGVGITQRYLTLIQNKVIAPLAIELRSLAGDAYVKNSPPSPAELEIAWGLHGELFYLAIRRWVYNMPVREDLNGIIENAIVRFLRGAPAAVRVVARSSAR